MSSTIRTASPRHSSWRSSRRLWARWKLSAGTDPLGKEGWMRVGEYLGQGYVSCWRKQWNGTMTTKMVCPKFFSNSCPTPGYIRGPAVTKAADYLEQAEYNTGNPEDDLKTQSFVKQLLYHPKLIRSAPYIVAAQHDSHTTSLRRILPAHPKKSLTAIQNIQLFSSFRPPHRLRLLSTSAGAAADGTNAATGGDGKMVTATKKGAAVLDQHIPDDIKEAYHVLQVGDEIYDATLNQTNVGNNNNKFYVIQVLESDVGGSFIIYHRWGRVGVRGKDKVQAYSTRNEAIYEFKGKFQSKTNNRWSDRKSFKPYAKKYTWIETDYGETDKETDKTEKKGSITDQIKESQLETRTAQFISLICDIGMMKQQMMEIGYNADKLPLGKLSKSTVLKGYNVLKRISNVISKADRIQLEQLTGEFYTVIPHNFGFRKMSEFIIDTPQKLKAKLEMVEALDEIEIATKLLEDDSSDQDDPLYAQYKQLCCDFTPLEAYSEEYSMIKTYLMNTRGKAYSGYTVDIVQIFKVSRHGETEKFQKFASTENRMLLWHGSRLSNWAGILSRGFRIAPPEAPVCGYMFSKGVHFADMFSKSAKYCCASEASRSGVLLLCEVALGDMNELLDGDYNANNLPQGKLSTKRIGRMMPDLAESRTTDDGVLVPLGKPKKDPSKRGCLPHNEYIVYDVDQIRMRYALHVKFNFRRR